MRKNISFSFPLFLLLMLVAGMTGAQQIINPPALEKLLAGKTKYYDIVDIVDNYYAKEKLRLASADFNALQTINRQFKMWQRWKMYNGNRLNADGTIGNNQYYTQLAFQQLKLNAVAEIQGATGNWVTLGPTNYNTTGGHNGGLGRVNCVAFNPNNANMIYAGTANGGLWRREPNGNWTALTDHIPSVSISGVVVNYNNGNDIYILTGDGDSRGNQGMFSAGVFESHDGGATWNASGQFPGLRDSTYTAYKLCQHPTNPAIFFACTNKGLYRSTNYCASWTRVNPNLWTWAGTSINLLPSYTDLEFKPGDPNTIYVSSNSVIPSFQRSVDGGLTFTPIANALMDAAQRLAIGVSANQPNWVYVLSGPSTGVGMFNGIFGSGNSGIGWSVNATTPNILGYSITGQDNSHQTGYDLAVAVNPVNANHIITGGIDCYTSPNGGATLTKRTHWNTQELTSQVSDYIHADIHNLTYNGNRLYACTDGGISYSDNHGVTWTNIGNGLNILQPYKIAGIETDANHWISGTQDNGAMYRNNSGFIVQHVGGGDGRSAIIDPDNVGNIWFTSNETIYVSSNSGATKTSTTPAGNDESWPTLTHNINNVNEILAGYGNGIFKLNAATLLWSNRGAGGFNGMVNCPSSSTRFYAANGRNFYRSDNSGDSWTDLSAKTGFPTNNIGISDIIVSQANSAVVYFTISGFAGGEKVYYSSNAGESWTNITSDLPNVATLSIASGYAGSIYIGNELGVFYKANINAPWTPFYNGLPKCPVNDLLVNFTAGKIRAATFGRGIWESDLFSPCATNLSVNGELRGSNYFEAGSSLTASQQAGGGVGTQLVYKANGNITMTTDMEVKDAGTGTKFKAYLGPCGQGLQLLSDSGSIGNDLLIIEELDTYKHKPRKDMAYYRIDGDALEFFIPDYGAVSIQKINDSGTTEKIVDEPVFALGLFRIRNAGADVGKFVFKYRGKTVNYE